MQSRKFWENTLWLYFKLNTDFSPLPIAQKSTGVLAYWPISSTRCFVIGISHFHSAIHSAFHIGMEKLVSRCGAFSLTQTKRWRRKFLAKLLTSLQRAFNELSSWSLINNLFTKVFVVQNSRTLRIKIQNFSQKFTVNWVYVTGRGIPRKAFLSLEAIPIFLLLSLVEQLFPRFSSPFLSLHFPSHTKDPFQPFCFPTIHNLLDRFCGIRTLEIITKRAPNCHRWMIVIRHWSKRNWWAWALIFLRSGSTWETHCSRFHPDRMYTDLSRY